MIDLWQCFRASISSLFISALAVRLRPEQLLERVFLPLDPPKLSYAKDDPLRELMRADASLFTLWENRASFYVIHSTRYIYDLKGNVIENSV